MSTTNIDHAEVMTELRAKQQQVWSSGTTTGSRR